MVRQIAHADVSRFPRVFKEILSARKKAVLGNVIVGWASDYLPVSIDVKRTAKVCIAENRGGNSVTTSQQST